MRRLAAIRENADPPKVKNGQKRCFSPDESTPPPPPIFYKNVVKKFTGFNKCTSRFAWF
jgi:hypothetical protein